MYSVVNSKLSKCCAYYSIPVVNYLSLKKQLIPVFLHNSLDPLSSALTVS